VEFDQRDCIFLSRVLGWVRLVVITNLFGARADLDAYFAAFRVPDFLFQLVAAGALSSALIPILAGLFARNEEARAWRVVSSVLNVLMLGLVSLAVLVAIFAPQIVPLVTPGFDLVNTELTVRLTRIMLLSPVLLALGAVASSVLNARHRFGAAAMAPIFYNLAIILAALFLAPLMGVDALAVGVVVGSLLHLFVQLPSLTGERFRLSFSIDLGDPAARQALLLMAPRAIGLGAGQLTFMVNTMLATGIGVGAVTAYNVAFTILQIPLGVIAMPLGVVIFPALSRAVAQGSVREFGALVVRSMRLLLYVMLFFSAVGIVLRRQVVALLFDFGFDDRALDLTANTLSFLLIGLAGHSLVVVLARSFYAGQDTRTPVITAVAEVAVSITVALATVGTLGLSGLALGLATLAFLGPVPFDRSQSTPWSEEAFLKAFNGLNGTEILRTDRKRATPNVLDLVEVRPINRLANQLAARKRHLEAGCNHHFFDRQIAAVHTAVCAERRHGVPNEWCKCLRPPGAIDRPQSRELYAHTRCRSCLGDAVPPLAVIVDHLLRRPRR
jgi:putative peptidoglycan lipid II flippase